MTTDNPTHAPETTITVRREDAVMIAEWLDQTNNPFEPPEGPEDQTWAAASVARDNLNHALNPDYFDNYCHQPGAGATCHLGLDAPEPRPTDDALREQARVVIASTIVQCLRFPGMLESEYDWADGILAALAEAGYVVRPAGEVAISETGLCGVCGRIGATIYRTTDGLWVCERHAGVLTRTEGGN